MILLIHHMVEPCMMYMPQYDISNGGLDTIMHVNDLVEDSYENRYGNASKLKETINKMRRYLVDHAITKNVGIHPIDVIQVLTIVKRLARDNEV